MEKNKLSDLMKQAGDLNLKTEKLLAHKSPSFPQFDFAKLEKANQELSRIHGEQARKEEEYRVAVVSALQGIEKNTALLTDMTILLKKNNENQDQVFSLFVKILEIMKSTSKEEAEGKFTDIMKRIAAISDSINGASSLYTLAQTVYTACKAIL